MSLLNISVAIILCVVACAFLRGHAGVSRKRHSRYRKKADKIHERLHSSDMNMGQVLAYLRKIDPYVFEELVLNAFEEHGFSVKRNRRYSGDGGIDGRVFLKGKEYLLQCKRYKSYINPKHVRQFCLLCEERDINGYFIHTGKTGGMSRDESRFCDKVTILSGKQLVDFLTFMR